LVKFLKKTKDLSNVFYFLKRNVHPDFYLTKNNERIYITEYRYFKELLNQSSLVLISEEGSEIEGVVLIWKGFGGNKDRKYVKINAINNNIANKLLTVLLWNCNFDLYTKIKKYSSYIQPFKDKNFIFIGGRGKEILLEYKYRRKEITPYVRNPN